jgi:hypothetical protein
MQDIRTRQSFYQANKIWYVIIPALLVVMIGFGLYAQNIFRVFQTPLHAQDPAALLISQADLEEEYGLRINLVAVTAAGGLVDVRLKILDAEKASQLLQEGKNLPQLAVTGSDVVLTASEDILPQGYQLENGGDLFLMYPNARNAVKSGTPVSIVFGELRLEPIPAK